IFFRFIDGFVFQTEGAKSYFSKTIQNKGIVINNPVFIKYNDFNLPDKRRKVIVNVGRLHTQKNQTLLINAFKNISNYFPEYKLEIYGEGPLEYKLENQIKALDLTDKVTLKGTTNDLFAEIVDASLFVLSSDYEGMPNALMEAMALGLPCISTNCRPGGASELINDGKNGKITPIGSTEHLSHAMIDVLKHPLDAEKMGKKAKEICNTHSKENTFVFWD